MTAPVIDHPARTAIAPKDLKKAFGTFPTGVTVVTCRTPDGAHHGATINAFTAVSLDPPLAQVTLVRGNKISQYLREIPFAINILGVEQQKAALTFAGIDTNEEPHWREDNDIPVLSGNAATLECELWAIYDGGDHDIVIGQVIDLEVNDIEPLSFVAGKFRETGRLQDGNPWDSCGDGLASGWFQGAPDQINF